MVSVLDRKLRRDLLQEPNRLFKIVGLPGLFGILEHGAKVSLLFLWPFLLSNLV